MNCRRHIASLLLDFSGNLAHNPTHVPFEFDITDFLTHQAGDTHRVTVRVFDSATNLTQPRGKQLWVPESKGIFYTLSSGIWQSVWLESVPSTRIADSSHGTILRSHNIRDGHLDARIVVLGRRVSQPCSIEIEASFGGIVACKSEKKHLPMDEPFVRFKHSMQLSRDQLRDLGSGVLQRDHIRSLYYTTKTLDTTRPINDNCGWEHVITDLSTFHSYADAPEMAERYASTQSIIRQGKSMFLRDIHGPDGAYDPGSKHERGAPILCTEFGGVNIATGDTTRKDNWGYTTAKDTVDLVQRVDNIVMATVKDGNICGVVWTQFSDIEQ